MNCVCSAQIVLYWKGHLKSYVLLICFLAIFLLNMFNIVITLIFRSSRRSIGAILFTFIFFGNVVVASIFILKLWINIRHIEMICEYKIIIYITHEFGTLTSGGSLLCLTAVNYIQVNQKTFQSPRRKKQIFRRTLLVQLCVVVINISVAASPALINRRIAFTIPICFQVIHSVGTVFICFKINRIVKLAVQEDTLGNSYMEHIKERLRIITPFVIVAVTLKTLLVTIRVLWSIQAIDIFSPTLVWLKLSGYLSFSITPVLYIISHQEDFIRCLSVIRIRNNRVREINVCN